MENKKSEISISKETLTIWLVDILPAAISTGIVMMYLIRILLLQFLDVWLERPYMYFIGIICAIGIGIEQKLKFVDHVVDKQRQQEDADTDELIQSVENIGPSIKRFFKGDPVEEPIYATEVIDGESVTVEKKPKTTGTAKPFKLNVFGEVVGIGYLLFAIVYIIAAVICWAPPCDTALGLAVLVPPCIGVMAAKGVFDTDDKSENETSNTSTPEASENETSEK